MMKSLVVCAVCLMSISAADAAWKCQMSNGKGQIWNGMGPTRAKAASNAMNFCAKQQNSTYARNCVLNWCKAGF